MKFEIDTDNINDNDRLIFFALSGHKCKEVTKPTIQEHKAVVPEVAVVKKMSNKVEFPKGVGMMLPQRISMALSKYGNLTAEELAKKCDSTYSSITTLMTELRKNKTIDTSKATSPCTYFLRSKGNEELKELLKNAEGKVSNM
jgi:hypothetical protein